MFLFVIIVLLDANKICIGIHVYIINKQFASLNGLPTCNMSTGTWLPDLGGAVIFEEQQQ